MKKLIFLSLLGFLTACTPPFIPQQFDDENNDHYSRGSYRGSYYIVNDGDTLHYIAYITDRDIAEIIQANAIVNPNKIYSGQKLNLWRRRYTPPAYGSKQETKFTNESTVQNNELTSSTSTVNKTAENHAVTYEKTRINPPVLNEKLNWQWPTTGDVISAFSAADFGNKGIDIEGQRGQIIRASANGKVVYAGSALRGYGNLIIIKHTENYLSAYAHNESLLVEEKQRVKQGDTIATMGSSGTENVRLHFEIRYKGRSVNPENYLPEV